MVGGQSKESTKAKENSSGRLFSVLKKKKKVTHNDRRAATVEGDLR